MSGRIRVASKEARTMDGVLFDSKAEMNRYAVLKILQRAGMISDLELQPRYVLLDSFEANGERYRPVVFVADFRYTEGAVKIVEDVKGHLTEVYRIKKKMLLARYPDINFREVKA
jgi:hypothetical protein